MYKVCILLFACILFNATAKPPNTGTFGRRIIGGTDSWAGQFPYAVAITVHTNSSTFFCSGTILTNQWILTAGQCVNNAQQFTITLGTNNLQDSQKVQVSTDLFVIPITYDPTSYTDDIALIKLRMPIEFTDYIKSVEHLPVFDVKLDTPMQTYGWGQVSDSKPGLVDHLQYVTVVAIPNEECKMYYGNQIVESMVCVDGEYNEGTCIGDSGGALLQHVGRGEMMHVGVSIFHSGDGCEGVQPSGYTRTQLHMEWITNVTGRAY